MPRPYMFRAGAWRSLEVDISRIAKQRGFNRDMQAVVDRVVELPEADHAGELDNLRRVEMLFHALQDLVRHRGRILRGRSGP